MYMFMWGGGGVQLEGTGTCAHGIGGTCAMVSELYNNNNNNNRRLVTLAEHTSDHGRQTNSSTEEKGEQV